MKGMSVFFGLPMILLTMVSCASSPNPLRTEWPFGAQFPYKESAITVKLAADPQLNLYDGRANSLHVCMYQLRDPNAFNKAANNEDGLYILLNQNCNFADGSVADAVPISVQPGENMKYVYNRAEGARYVAFVAGYFESPQKQRVVRLDRVPVVFAKQSTGMFSSEEVPVAANMHISLTLGADQIQAFNVSHTP